MSPSLAVFLLGSKQWQKLEKVYKQLYRQTVSRQNGEEEGHKNSLVFSIRLCVE